MKMKHLIFLISTLALFCIAGGGLRAQSRVELELELVDSTGTKVEETAKPKRLTRRELKELSESWSEEYVDTASVNKRQLINDYSMIGVQYGVGLSQMYWNPSNTQKMVFIPYNIGVTYTRYGKMFGFMPYFGIQLGVFYTREAFQLKAKDDDEESYIPTVATTGESGAVMDVIEVPVLAHCHVDFWKMKILVNAGLYGGYRLSINRTGDRVAPEYASSFAPFNNRIDFGIKAGVGFAFIFDPVEIHFQGMYKHSLSSIYKPDYYSDTYYRYAYPSNIVISVGLHFQITRRTGKTQKMLRQEAYDRLFGTPDEGN